MDIKEILQSCLITFALMGTLYSQAYLSDLNAGKNNPIYTTYAAPLDRSEFIIDEGYVFKWYDLQNGINFESDNAGSLDDFTWRTVSG